MGQSPGDILLGGLKISRNTGQPTDLDQDRTR